MSVGSETMEDLNDLGTDSPSWRQYLKMSPQEYEAQRKV
jgi:hypothetical protein